MPRQSSIRRVAVALILATSLGGAIFGAMPHADGRTGAETEAVQQASTAAGFARQLLMPAGAVLPCRRQGHTVPEMDILECAKVETVRQFGSDSVLA